MQRSLRLLTTIGVRSFSSTAAPKGTSLPPKKPVKETTGLVGVPVVPNAVPILKALYERTLSDLSNQIDAGSPYRIDVEAITRHRLQILQQHESDIEAIETKIDCGQIEELIMQAEDELELIPVMASWKPWEDVPDREIPFFIQK